MKVNQKGFSVVEILIVVVVVGLLGAVGWLVYDRQKTKDSSSATTTKTVSKQEEKKPEPVKPEPALSASWLLRESDDASIRIPDGFDILAVKDESFAFVLPDQPQGTLKYTKGEVAKVVGEPHKHFELGLIVGFNQQGFNDRGTEQRQFKTNSGLNVGVKLFEKTVDPDGVDFPKGTKHLKYTVTKGEKYINVDYAYLGEGYVSIIDEMVRSAEIK